MDASALVARLTAPDTRADPYPLYEQAHRLGPVLWVSDTFVVVTGYAEADRVLRDRDFGVLDREPTAAVFGGTEEPPSWGLLGRSILQSNPPVHTRLRKPIAAVFTARRIPALRPAVENAVDRLLAGMAEAGRDWCAGLGVVAPNTSRVNGTLSDGSLFKTWTLPPDQQQPEAGHRSTGGLRRERDPRGRPEHRDPRHRRHRRWSDPRPTARCCRRRR
ncbi:hypothetical protein ACIRL2_16040 [Embleya sp. NPDC127516]|uniref:hypothetical protein n=1 Tax=Embleya sp. NPDC127516 TaxID=3363990 RepID=UPI0037F879F1